MKHGPRTMLSRFPRNSTRMAIAASPAPRKTALIRNSSMTVTLPPSITRVNALPDCTTSGDAPIRPQQGGRVRRRQDGNQRGDDDAQEDRLRGRARRAVRVLLADAPRDERHRADRQPHRDRVDDRQHRLGQADRRDRIGAEVRHPEHVGDGEDRLHRHLDHHRHREHDHRPPDRRGRVVDWPARGTRRGASPRRRRRAPATCRGGRRFERIRLRHL